MTNVIALKKRIEDSGMSMTYVAEKLEYEMLCRYGTS